MNKQSLPRVSVVIPTHNRCQLLTKLLTSLSQQTYPNDLFDINIIHNYTDDGTEEFVAELMLRSPIKITYTKKYNRTPTPSRHHGGMHASGEIIAFIDDDCIASPEWLAQGIKPFLSSTTKTITAKQVGLVQGLTMPNPDHQRKLLEKTVNIPQKTIFFETCNIFYSKNAFDEVGGFSEEFMDKFYGEDTDLGWKVEKAGYLSKFSASAVVKHHVFHVSIWKWLKEPLFFEHLPFLVKKYPDFREHMYARYFLTIETAYFQLLILAILLAFIVSPWVLLLSVPYFIQRYKGGTNMPNRLLRLIRIGAGLPRSLFTWYALVTGSIKYRSILL